MNLTKLFEMQKELDAKIVREKGLEGQDLLTQKILALQVELGECANEWRGFKFWSTNQEPRKPRRTFCELCDGRGVTLPPPPSLCPTCKGMGYIGEKHPLLEEYVDCLHFILSIGLSIITNNEFDYDDDWEYLHDVNISVFTEGEPIKQFIGIYQSVAEFTDNNDIEIYQDIFLYFIGLGKLLGFTWEQIEQAYIAKNEVNHQRQASGY